MKQITVCEDNQKTSFKSVLLTQITYYCSHSFGYLETYLLVETAVFWQINSALIYGQDESASGGNYLSALTTEGVLATGLH